MIEVRYDRGVYLPNEDIWLDPSDAKPFAFVSHAHSDHIAAHDEIIVSERTARLMQARLPGERNEHVLNFGEKATVRGLDVTLIPAGQSVDTIAVPAVLAVFNWPKNTDRYRRVERFVENLFTRWEKFRQPPRHPKWRDVNLAATVPGWTRWAFADEMLTRVRAKETAEAPSGQR